MKNYIGISRDHSRSMYTIANKAARDFNTNISAIQEAARVNELDTIVSVVKCGVGVKALVEREVINSNAHVLRPIDETRYIADGYATPLWESVGDLITIMNSVPDANDPEVSFLIMVITDGENNVTRDWSVERLTRTIRELQATDRWTFVFRVPRGHSHTLVRFGIPEGNILEWDQTERGIQAASTMTNAAVSSYFTNRKQGVRSTSKFYADLRNVSINEVKQNLNDVSRHITRYSVSTHDHGIAIKSFVERYTPYRIGSVFYQLTKTEKVQESKSICICERGSGAIYTGTSARDLLGLPHVGAITLAPHNLGNYDVFVQSTSVNRKLVGDTTVLYYPDFAR